MPGVRHLVITNDTRGDGTDSGANFVARMPTRCQDPCACAVFPCHGTRSRGVGRLARSRLTWGGSLTSAVVRASPIETYASQAAWSGNGVCGLDSAEIGERVGG